MSDNSTGYIPPAIPAPPPGLNYIAAIKPALNFLLIGQTLGAVLVPMLIAVFFFSTRILRKSTMFWANVIVLALGIIESIFNAAFEIHSILSPQVAFPIAPYIVYAAITSLIPFMIELILFLRILAVYPYNTTPRAQFIAIMTFPVLMKIARLVNLAYYLAKYNTLTNQNSVTAGVVSIETLPNSEIEWFLQVFDNLYTSAVFLVRLNYRPFFGQSDGFRSASLTKKFRGLFWIATSNFVIPVFLSLTQAILYLVNKQNSLVILQINLANNYISIIAVVFATLWASGNSWYREHIPDGTDVISTFRIRHITTPGGSNQFPVFRRGASSGGTKPSDLTPTVQATSQSGDDSEQNAFSLKDDIYPMRTYASGGVVRIEHDTRIDRDTHSSGSV